MSLTDIMAEALRLTRSGDLVGATEVLLYGGTTPPAPTVHDLTPQTSRPRTLELGATGAAHAASAAASASDRGRDAAASAGASRAASASARANATAKASTTARASAAATLAAALKKAAVAAKAATAKAATKPRGATVKPAHARAAHPSHASLNDAPGSFQAHTYSGSGAGAAGNLGYKLYTPHGAAAGMPLVVMLHGCTQSPDDFAAGTAMNALADELGFFVAYPGQTHARHAQKCWNWYRSGDQQRDRGEPALIAGLTRELIADHQIDPARVYAAGLSAGGAAAAILASAYPDLYAAVGIHSGLACGAAHDTTSALAAMRQGGGRAAGARHMPERFVPVITFHGDRDATVAEVNAREIVAAATRDTGVALTTSTEAGGEPGGRAWTRAQSRDAAGTLLIEQWTIAGAGHAWSGGSAAGSYTDPAGPDASRAMLRFFLER